MKVEHWDQRCPPAYRRKHNACEKCWNDAFSRAYQSSMDQLEWYRKLLNDRKDKPCVPKDQAGEWWNEQLKIDERWLI